MNALDITKCPVQVGDVVEFNSQVEPGVYRWVPASVVAIDIMGKVFDVQLDVDGFPHRELMGRRGGNGRIRFA